MTKGKGWVEKGQWLRLLSSRRKPPSLVYICCDLYLSVTGSSAGYTVTYVACAQLRKLTFELNRWEGNECLMKVEQINPNSDSHNDNYMRPKFSQGLSNNDRIIVKEWNYSGCHLDFAILRNAYCEY